MKEIKNIYLERADNIHKRIESALELNSNDYEMLLTSMYYECLNLMKAILFKKGESFSQIEYLTKNHKESQQALLYVPEVKSLVPKIAFFLIELNKLRYLKNITINTILNEYEKSIFTANQSQYTYLQNELRKNLS